MDEKPKVKNTVIKQHFYSMEYGKNTGKTEAAIEWFNKQKTFFAYIEKADEKPTGNPTDIKSYVDNKGTLFTVYNSNSDTVEKILENYTKKSVKWISTEISERIRLINLFSAKIEKKVDLFTQIDVCARGILAKDTKNNVSLLAHYLQYYADFCYYVRTASKPSWAPKGVVVAILPEESPVFMFGLVLGPALCAGYNVVLQPAARITPIAALLIELAKEAGIPEGVIRMIPGEVEIQTFFTHSSVAVVSCFGDLNSEKYNICNLNNCHMISFSSYKIPMLVFEDSDIDSACDALANNMCCHHGTLPYSVGEVLVQESIFQIFVDKLKARLNKIKAGEVTDNLADVCYPSFPKQIENYKDAINAATTLGVEIFKSGNQVKDFAPTLLIGGRVYPNDVIKESRMSPVITVTGFRTLSEAVNLANNSRQGFGALVWSEKINIVFEVFQKLKVSNVWINCDGKLAPDVPFAAQKSSGPSHFGGVEGVTEYICLETLSDPERKDTLLNSPDDAGFDKVVAAAKKAQESWSKLPGSSRNSKIQSVIENLQTQKKSTSDADKTKWLDSWIEVLYQGMSHVSSGAAAKPSSNFQVTSYREPRGVLAIEIRGDIHTHSKELIAAAIISGNAVILVDSSKEAFYTELSKVLPAGVCSVVPYSLNVIRSAALHKEVDAYFGGTVNKIFVSLPLKDRRKFASATTDWVEVLCKVTLMKNMQVSYGQSFM